MKPGERIVYVPLLAAGDRSHPACRAGVIVAISGQSAIVLFDGWTWSQGAPLERLFPETPGDWTQLRLV